MKHIHLKREAHNALILGVMCFISYLAVYFLRNIMGTATPMMIESGGFTAEHIGSLSAVFFGTYAVGQLINGIVGDKIKAKYMMSAGLFLSGIANIVFVYVRTSKIGTTIAYGLVGLFLSMIYGPMTKVVSENVNLNYAHRCGIGYTFASFFGSPLAGLTAMFLSWSSLFMVGGGLLIGIGMLLFACFCLLERKQIITYGKFQKPKQQGGSIKILLKHQIVRFTLISIITGIVRTSVVFWLPTYLYQNLKFSEKTSALIFTISTLFISLAAFVALFIYETVKKNMNLTISIAFGASTIFFGAMFMLKHPILNIICMILAILMSNCAANMLWSYYCPNLRDTGMVSSATGFLDFMSYIAAAVANQVFPGAVDSIGWTGLILVWMGLVAFGFVISLPFEKWFKRAKQ